MADLLSIFKANGVEFLLLFRLIIGDADVEVEVQAVGTLDKYIQPKGTKTPHVSHM